MALQLDKRATIRMIFVLALMIVVIVLWAVLFDWKQDGVVVYAAAAFASVLLAIPVGLGFAAIPIWYINTVESNRAHPQYIRMQQSKMQNQSS